MVQGVDRPDAVHAADRQDDAAVGHAAAADMAGIAALRRDRQPDGGAQADHLGGLGSRGRLNDGGAVSAEKPAAFLEKRFHGRTVVDPTLGPRPRCGWRRSA
jgi:hypothetical protein